jgi:hypothetical protein
MTMRGAGGVKNSDSDLDANELHGRLSRASDRAGKVLSVV